MSAKYAPITASLLARKGTAGPSGIFKSTLDWNALPPAPPRSAPDLRVLAHEKPPAPVTQTPELPAEDHHPAPRDDAHHLRKIQVALPDHDHERLRILSARRETSRQQIVREALAAYFTMRAEEYGGECRCLSNAGGHCACAS